MSCGDIYVMLEGEARTRGSEAVHERGEVRLLRRGAAGEFAVAQAEAMLAPTRAPAPAGPVPLPEAGIREAPEGGQPGADQLVAMRIHGVAPEYVRDLRDAGLVRVTADQLVALRIHGAEPGFVRAFSRDMRELGFPDPTPDQLVAARIHNLAAESVRAYVAELDDIGYAALSLDQVIDLMANRVDRRFIEEMRALGLGQVYPKQLVQLKRPSMDADLIELLRAADRPGEARMETNAPGDDGTVQEQTRR